MFLYHEIHDIMEFKVHQPSLVKKLGERRKKYAKFVSSQSKAKNSLSQWYHYGLIYCPLFIGSASFFWYDSI
ncbi:hypothetical protein D927_00917 [Enterococcus faecalis 02-MB-BW-10]|nr:hypothetical protein D927_00917 [Enterococcus faecalis 02-MB-BW-10]